MLRLSDLKVGDKARISRITADNSLYRHKLLSLGLLPGSEITLTHIAPFGDPVQITCRGTRLALRSREANILQLEALEASHD